MGTEGTFVSRGRLRDLHRGTLIAKGIHRRRRRAQGRHEDELQGGSRDRDRNDKGRDPTDDPEQYGRLADGYQRLGNELVYDSHDEGQQEDDKDRENERIAQGSA